MDINNLKKFISYQSVDNNEDGNQKAIAFVLDTLSSMGFYCRVEGQDITDQPCVVGHFPGRGSSKKIVLYGHYDVAEVNENENWKSLNPFTLQELDGRIYARGIADNKGPLFARLEAVSELLKSSSPVPEILWLIQGEEEVETDTAVAKSIFKSEIARYEGNVFIDETGFNDVDSNEQLFFLWRPNASKEDLEGWHALIQKTAPTSRLEFRHLNKLNGIDACPLLDNLSDDSVYIGFGPNDRFHQIHRKDESLNTDKLNYHKKQFKLFLECFAKYSPNE